LRERYKHELQNLTKDERKALDKVFEDDTFTLGMMNTRTIGDHVKDRDGPVLYTKSNAPVQLTVESSAMGVFAAPFVVAIDAEGKPHPINHSEDLIEMVLRIERALKSKHTVRTAVRVRLDAMLRAGW
jgi:hypothetical protein